MGMSMKTAIFLILLLFPLNAAAAEKKYAKPGEGVRVSSEWRASKALPAEASAPRRP